MQVSQTNDFTTHATVGAGKVHAFGIAQSAEFFRVLSDSLYTDKPRAMVREVLCNAWDSHIVSGCTNIPIQVTVDDEFFIVQDFGSGIAPDKMGEIYCTYGGGSTKLHDGKQTGGFSLGSKSPFCYSEHFEVQSCYAGQKTIYNLSMASLAADGLPACQTIVTMPTSSTGLKVTVPVKQRHDIHTLAQLVQEIARFGEMNVILNGRKCDTIPFSTSDAGFAVVNSITPGAYIRYGAVIYPVPPHPTYAYLLEKAQAFVRVQGYSNNWNGFALILQAPSNTIAVTPSRESLQLNDMTVDTITDLLKKFITRIETEHHHTRVEAMHAEIDKCWQHHNFSDLFRSNVMVPNASLNQYWKHQNAPLVTDAKTLAHRHFYYLLSTDDKLARKSRLLRLKSIGESGHDRTGLARSLKQYLSRRDSESFLPWFQRSVLLPIYRKIAAEPLLKFDRCSLAYFNGYERPAPVRFTKINEKTFHQIGALEITKGVAILSYNQTDTGERLKNFPIIKHRYGSVNGMIYYNVPRNKPECLEAARRMFEGLGYQIIDLTVRHPWEPRIVREPVVRSIPKPRNSGYAKLSALKFDKRLVAETIDLPDIDRTINPEFVIKLTPAAQVQLDEKRTLPTFGRDITNMIYRLFGDRGAAVTSQAQYDKAIKDGAKSLEDFLKDWVVDVLGSSKAFKRYRSHQAGLRCKTYYNLDLSDQNLLQAIYRDQSLMRTYRIWEDLSELEKQAEDVLKALGDDVAFDLFGKAQCSAAALKLVKAVATNQAGKYLNTGLISTCIFRQYQPEDYGKIRKLIITAIKG